MRVSRSLFIAAGAVVCLALGSMALADSEGENRGMRGRSNLWALLFQIDRDFNLAPFQGSTISAMRTWAGGNAIRFGTSISASKNETDRDGISVDVSAHYVDYSHPDREVTFFIGAGPTAGLADSHSGGTASVSLDGETAVLDSRSDYRSWYVGVHVLAGAEWLLTRHLALSAEYGSSLLYSHYRSDRVERLTPESAGTPTVKEYHSSDGKYSVGATAIRLGLTVYL
jgi:hypothetical protein